MSRLQRRLTELRQRSHRYAWLRLALFGGGAAGQRSALLLFGGVALRAGGDHTSIAFWDSGLLPSPARPEYRLP